MQSVSLDHKQIAFVTFDPSIDALIIHFHKGDYRSISPVLSEEFETLAAADNKVDVLCKLIAGRNGWPA
ncbi:hypothetical protein [Paenibacillus alkalitolerans]|uniref:hypothetical protein n=1 Tax=Paenibacillus alkalitolerans TaxID=2799335 RepID=UPI0018F5D024|nr:hypothetical protein [Paenibacillus alkalitolerans]